MTIGERVKSVMARLIPLYHAHPQGGMAIDSEKVTEVVRSDPQAVVLGVRMALDSGVASQFGWGLWLTVACVFNQEFDDDSLVVVVKAAAAQAGEALPSNKAFFPHGTGNEKRQKQKVILEMDERDVRDCDAFRMIKLLRLDAMAPHARVQMFGNCIVTCARGQACDVFLRGGLGPDAAIARSLFRRVPTERLDEATVGLDPASRRHLLDEVLGLRASGVGVLWASHLVDEAEAADRVLVLHKGELLAQGTPAELVAASGCATLAEAFLKMTRSGQAVEPA